MERRLLIVDDDINSSKMLTRILAASGYEANYTPTAEEALSMLANGDYDLLLIDMILPGMDGLAFLQKAKEVNPELLAVIITAYGSITTAVNALKLGASDFIEKPVIPEKLLLVLDRIFEEKRLKLEVKELRADLRKRYRFENLVGTHPKMQSIFNLIESLSTTDSAVFITGETGTGKDLVARAIHFHSQRKAGPFIAVNCAAIPESLLESELFGYEKGAFTGAQRRRIGKLELADRGTLFLDEIADMPYALQSKLLRTIQDKQIERLGGNKLISLDFRIISATNKDISKELASGRFRLDLYYRLNVVPIHLPPLRERLEDLPLLVDHFLEKIAKASNKEKPRLSQKAMTSLMMHSWPGNVRELENVLERAMILAEGDLIGDIFFSHSPYESRDSATSDAVQLDVDVPLKTVIDRAVENIERTYLTKLLTKHRGSIKLTAAAAQIDVRTVLRKMKQFNLNKGDFKISADESPHRT